MTIGIQEGSPNDFLGGFGWCIPGLTVRLSLKQYGSQWVSTAQYLEMVVSIYYKIIYKIGYIYFLYIIILYVI